MDLNAFGVSQAGGWSVESLVPLPLLGARVGFGDYLPLDFESSATGLPKIVLMLD